MKRLIPILVIALFAVMAQAQTFTTLKSFGGLTNVSGSNLQSKLVQGPDGMLYGTASKGGGGNSSGTVFKLQPDGSGFTVLKLFTNSVDGAFLPTGLTLSGSTLYGTTQSGGSSNQGTVFKVNTDGTGFMVLKNFAGADGTGPAAGLTLSGSTLYGTTFGDSLADLGAVFRLNTNGTGFMVLKHFTGSDGAGPYADLTLSGSTIYGTTIKGGSSDYGTVFKMNTDGTGYLVIKHLTLSGGAHPLSDLTLSGSTLYGTTSWGGSWDHGNVFKVNTDGTGFTEIRPFGGTVFGGTDGSFPLAGLTLSGSTLYGTTFEGGNTEPGFFGRELGTVFKVNVDGTGYAVIRRFTGADGARPYGGLILSGNTLYGTTFEGGSSYMLGGDLGFGTVFKLELPGAFTPIPLNAQRLGGAIVLNWSNPAFTLQSASAMTGTYTNIPGATSPYTNSISGPQRFFRLIGN